MNGNPPAWRRPEGVDASLWAYMQSPDVAELEAAEESTAPLARFDRRVIADWIQPGWRVADLGCGTGRISLDLARRGNVVISIDLSSGGLRRLAGRLEPHDRVLPIRADLGRTEMLRPAAFDAALLMYSTLGMVRGRINRRRVLARAASAVRPDGVLIVHAHNFWAHRSASALTSRLRLAGRPGRGWLERYGDIPMRYAGVPGVAIHTYRWIELRADLAATGWRVFDYLPLARGSAGPLRRPWIGHAWRSDGWIVRAERTSKSED